MTLEEKALDIISKSKIEIRRRDPSEVVEAEHSPNQSCKTYPQYFATTYCVNLDQEDDIRKFIVPHDGDGSFVELSFVVGSEMDLTVMSGSPYQITPYPISRAMTLITERNATEFQMVLIDALQEYLRLSQI